MFESEDTVFNKGPLLKLIFKNLQIIHFGPL